MSKPLILALPVDSAWTFVGFDIHFIVIHIDLGNVHLKVVGQELDGLPDSSYPRPTRRLEYLLQGGQVRACSCRGEHGSARLQKPHGQTDRRGRHSGKNGSGGRIQSSAAGRGRSFPKHHPAGAGASRAAWQCQVPAPPAVTVSNHPPAQNPALLRLGDSVGATRSRRRGDTLICDTHHSNP